MAFGIGMNTEYPDRGALSGKQEDVACDCWFSSSGATIPRLVKFQDEEGRIRCLENIQVREIEKMRRCGIWVVQYRCAVFFQEREYHFRLIFHMEACQWKMIWEN